ncbi:hypothetical protein PCPL58_p4046 (plasmid) [Pseudomonas cerasi]|nr:hypothetical protein PCPL58_p4046 [Pseudomonas cerasi]
MIRRGRHHLRRQTMKCPLTRLYSTSRPRRRSCQSSRTKPLNQLRGLLNNKHRERPPQALLPTWMIRRGRHHLRRQTKKCPPTRLYSTGHLWRRPSQSSQTRQLNQLRLLLNNRRQ